MSEESFVNDREASVFVNAMACFIKRLASVRIEREKDGRQDSI